MKIKVLFLAMICVPIYPSEAVKPWSWQHLKQVATQARGGQSIGVGKSVTQAPHYSPWSWQHLKNLVGLATVSRPAAQALTQTHRRKFKDKMLQSEVEELEKLVDTNNRWWKYYENFDKYYEKVLQEDRPDRYVDPNLSPEWIKHAEKALEERGINPRSINFTQGQFTAANTEISRVDPLRWLWGVPYGMNITPSLSFKSLDRDGLADDDRQAILSYIAKHEATHFEQRHNIRVFIYLMSQAAQGKELADTSAFIAAAEKTAETLPTLKSRQDAANVLTAHKYGMGYLETNPDIQVQKSYWDVLHAQEQKDKLAKSAQQLQKRVQQHPVNTAINRQAYNLMQRLSNTMPSVTRLPATSTPTLLPSREVE